MILALLSMTTKNDINHISGDYQYLALNHRGPIQKQWHKNRHNLLKFLKFFDHNDSVLDLGCGSGNVVLEFAPFVRNITGVDNNRECISFLSKKIKRMGLSNAKAIKMDILKLRLNGVKFSKIIMTEVLEHLSQEQAKLILKEIKKISAPNAKILITTPNYQSLWPLMEYLIDKTRLAPKLWGEQHLIKYNRKNLRILLGKAGFTIEKLGTINTVSPFVAVLNPNLADKLSCFEFKYSPVGSLLYCQARLKKSSVINQKI